MDFISFVNENYSKLNDTEKSILAFIINHLDQCIYASIIELGQKTHTSKSSIHRFIQKLGFENYPSFKVMIKNYYEKQKYYPIDCNYSLLDDINYTLQLNTSNLFDNICIELKKARCVYAYATGFGQQNCLNEFARNMMFTNVAISIVPSQAELELKSRTLQENDLLIAISLSGNTPTVIPSLQECKLRNVPIISITNYSENIFSNYAKYSLYYKTTRTSFMLNGVERDIISFIPCLIVLDRIFRNYIFKSDH